MRARAVTREFPIGPAREKRELADKSRAGNLRDMRLYERQKGKRENYIRDLD